VGDVTSVGTPRAGVFAEGAARIVAAVITASIRGGGLPEAYQGAGSCYVELGDGKVGRVDVNFLGGPKPTGIFRSPVEELVAEKLSFGTSRAERWFGATT
jgi:sulfide:quinone oxidoreductase